MFDIFGNYVYVYGIIGSSFEMNEEVGVSKCGFYCLKMSEMIGGVECFFYDVSVSFGV